MFTILVPCCLQRQLPPFSWGLRLLWERDPPTTTNWWYNYDKIKTLLVLLSGQATENYNSKPRSVLRGSVSQITSKQTSGWEGFFQTCQNVISFNTEGRSLMLHFFIRYSVIWNNILTHLQIEDSVIRQLQDTAQAVRAHDKYLVWLNYYIPSFRAFSSYS